MAAIILILVLTFFSPLSAFAQALPAVPAVPPGLLNRQWEAVWISPPERDLTSYGVFHFRKRFNLVGKPAKFVIHVSADNRYKLYVNGTEAGDGPSRGDLWHWRFETIDIAPFLREGENLLAAVVWNCGPYAPFAQMTYETAFLVQGDAALEAAVNTDSTWKVIENPAYIPLPADAATMHAFTVVGPLDNVDGARYPWGWEQPGYNDESWQSAVRNAPATPRGIRWMSAHWHLVPRMIPPMEKKPQAAPLVRRSDGVQAESEIFRQGKKLLVAANTKATLLLDQGYLTAAYPELTVSGGQGAQITLTYAEALLDGQGNKANRDSVAGMHIFGYADHFRPDGGENRLFTSLWFRTFRYLQLEVETDEQPLTIESVTSRSVGYPFERRAVFTSDDPALTKIWDVGWRTARLCAGETYFDCPYYEQLNYAGDTRIQALISLYAAGDDRLMRKAITQFDDSRIPDGLTQSRYPSYVTQIIPPYSLFWIAMVHDYWMHRDDPEFVHSFLPGIREALGWFERHLTENGLLGHLPWWNFVDWANEYDSGVCPGADEGETSVISLQYVYALQYADEMFRSFGNAAEADHFRELAVSISKAVKTRCWNERRGLYAETPEQEQFSQHANIMAILTGLVPQQEQAALMEKILTGPDLIQCTFYYRFYLTRALKKAGLADRYLETLEPWKKMLEIGLTTFAENPEPTRSDCHAWSASPVYDLLATVCGIEPAEPGFRKVRIEPHPGKLKEVRASLPHPLGPLELALTRAGSGGYSGEITLPAGLTGELVWRGKSTELHPGKQQIRLDD